MARVTVPVIEKTRYSSVAPATQTAEPPTLDDSLVADSPPPADNKRKRPALESFPSSYTPMMPPKIKTNPFARRASLEAAKNPFARKAEPNKTIQKSESFFDKVDAAEAENNSRKRPSASTKNKEKKESSKQATLFSMLSKTDKSSRTTKKSESTSLEPQKAIQPDSESQLTMTEVDISDSVMEDSLNWEETQLVDDGSQTMLLDM